MQWLHLSVSQPSKKKKKTEHWLDNNDILDTTEVQPWKSATWQQPNVPLNWRQVNIACSQVINSAFYTFGISPGISQINKKAVTYWKTCWVIFQCQKRRVRAGILCLCFFFLVWFLFRLNLESFKTFIVWLGSEKEKAKRVAKMSMRLDIKKYTGSTK